MVNFLRNSKMDGKKEAEDILKKAQQEAQTILENATQQADKIVKEAHLFTRRIEADVKKSLEKSGDSMVTEGNLSLNEFLSSAEEALRSFLKKAETEFQSAAARFSEQSEKRLSILEKTMVDEMKKDYQTMLKTAMLEKKKRLEDTEKAIQKQIPGLINGIMNEAIPLEGHEEIVHRHLQHIKESIVWE